MIVRIYRLRWSIVRENSHEDLNVRVWNLFEDAGFETKPNSSSAKEHELQLSHKKIPIDLYAVEPNLGVTVIASNKSGAVRHWSEHIAAYKDYGRRLNADKVLFVVTGSEIDETQRNHFKSEGVALWTEDEL